MRWERFVLGDLAANSYLLWEEESGEALCIDPGGPVKDLYAKLESESLQLLGIILTHGHVDHIAGANELIALTKAPVMVHAAEEAMIANPVLNLSRLFGSEVMVRPDRLLNDRETISLGNSAISVYHTPGHTPGGICLYWSGLLFSGDTLFAGSIGRSDLPGGNHETLLNSIFELLRFPDETIILPGHGEETSIGQERRSNPFLVGGKNLGDL